MIARLPVTARESQPRRRASRVGGAVLLAVLALISGWPFSLGAQEGERRPDSASASPSLAERVARLRANAGWFGVPDVPATEGDRTIPADATVSGPVAVRDGTLHVRGTVEGDAISYGGDVVVYPGGWVAGDAIAALGEVRLDEGGVIDGGIRSLRGTVGVATAPPLSPMERTGNALLLLFGWAAVVIPIGIGVLVFAGQYLDGVAETMEQSFGKAFGVGVLGQIALVPGLALTVLLLAITLIGILLIPFAIVGYAAVAAGLVMLGTLAAARVVGSAVLRQSRPGAAPELERRRMLRALLIGLAGLFLPWLIAALLASVPVAGGIARAVAVGLTWVGVSAGFGAALLSRGGTRAPARAFVAPPPPQDDDISWQTPTPVGGVVAARRPTPAASSRGTR